jgi:hypothetical protein
MKTAKHFLITDALHTVCRKRRATVPRVLEVMPSIGDLIRECDTLERCHDRLAGICERAALTATDPEASARQGKWALWHAEQLRIIRERRVRLKQQLMEAGRARRDNH